MSKRVWLPVKGGTVLLTMRTVTVLLTATLLFDRRLLSKITWPCHDETLDREIKEG